MFNSFVNLDNIVLDWNTFFLFIFVIIFTFFICRFLYVFYNLFNLNIINLNYLTTFNKYSFHSFYIFLFIFFFFLPLFLFIVIWQSPTLVLFNNHIVLTSTSFYTFYFYFFILCVIFLVVFFFFVDLFFTNLTQIFFIWTVILFFIFVNSLWVVSNFFSFFFVFEFINLILLCFLISIKQLPIITIQTEKNNFLTSFILFFWINAISSILLFFILTNSLVILPTVDFSTFFFISNFETIGLFSEHFKTVFICLFFVFFFFKLGLPPFIFWKFFFFNRTNILFILLYNIPYFITLVLFLIYVFYVLNVFIDNGLMFFFTVVLFASLICLLFWTNVINTWGIFFAISSSLTVLFIYVLIWFSFNNGLTVGTKTSSYFYLYLLTYGLTFIVLTASLFGLKIFFGADSFTLNWRRLVNFSSERFFKYLLFFLFSSFSGLPPFFSFFVKLSLVANLNLFIFPSFFYLFILLFFLFILVLFYFRLVRISLTQKQLKTIPLKNYDSYTKYSCFRLSQNILNRYTFVLYFLFILFFGFFLLNDLCLLFIF